MFAMTSQMHYGTGMATRVRASVALCPPAVFAANASWLHVRIGDKTGTGARRLGELSP
jgi:hypothetical protein